MTAFPAYIPGWGLNGYYDAFSLDGPDGYELLLRKILDRPRYKRPASGSAPDLPVHTIAPRFPRPGGDEYATETDNLLVRILDHTEQLARIRKLLEDGDNDRVIALVDACSEDWPSYLADHVHLEFGPKQDRDLKEAVSLRLGRFDDSAFREALLEAVPGATGARNQAARQSALRGWIDGACSSNDTGLRVLYIPVALERYGHHLPQIIRGAHATLDGLGRFAPGSRVLVLFACVHNGERPPLLWRWLSAASWPDSAAATSCPRWACSTNRTSTTGTPVSRPRFSIATTAIG